MELEKARKSKKIFKSVLNQTKRVKWEHKSEEQKCIIKSVEIFYEL